jgi:MoaA/NifB/PqqE/SkfB family radical SAM enzyme
MSMDRDRAWRIAQEMRLGTGETALFHGNSMSPFLEDGDRLTVAPVAWSDIVPGDVVTYRLEDKFPTLRVVAKTPNKLWMIGDNWPNRRFEAWPEHILGRVVARTRSGSTVSADSLSWRARSQYALQTYRAGSAVARAKRLPERVASRLAKRRSQRFPRPPNVQVNVSSTCNLKCRMCPYLEVHQDPTHLEFMSPETFERILPIVVEIGAVHFSGSGEPLFNRRLFDFMALVRRAAPGASIDLTTNGTLLTEERARGLVELGVNKIHVSFDGLPERAETIRINVNGRKVIDNIRRLAEIKRAAGSRYPIVQINYMLGYGTYWDLVKFVQLGREIGVGEIQLLEMQPATAEDAADNLCRGTHHDQGAALKTALMLARYYNIALHLPTVTEGACYYPYNPHIAEDGEVYPCCYLDYDGRQLYHGGAEHRLPAVTFGNAARQPFDEIWGSADFVALRERNARGEFDAHCRVCYDIRHETAERVKEVLGLR